MIPAAVPADILRILRTTRVDLSDEKRAQADIAAALAATGRDIQREVRLAPGDVIDLMADDIGIEVKLKGARKRAIWGQLERYAGHDRVSALILASNLAMGVPGEVRGKPLWFVPLGRAWL